MELPELPTTIDRYLAETAKCKTQAEIRDATKSFIEYESKLREIFAQYPDHAAAKQEHVLPLFGTGNPAPAVRVRDPLKEPEDVRDRYLLALQDDERLADGDSAIVQGLGEFKTNFNLFSESSLVDLDWSNVVAAGSSVVTALLPVRSPHNESKRALRNYYHQILAPASDVDLFIYGLNEEQAVEKIKDIERAVRDSILSETTTIRTKNAITIVSEYPTRHVQIVLRLYKNVTEILTGFDVDCSCVAYDGKQVWATPRSMAAYMTQLNTVDLTRRSPSYENRLSKYSHRGFEVFWPALDRSRIDPTIYERSFSRVLGLARLLVLEKLPHPSDRDTYLARRREERGRPALPWHSRNRHALPGNVKDSQPDDIAEWVEEDEVSNYHTFTVPYGPKYNAKKVEKLLFTKDLLLNAEWNKPKDRETNLHRHPAFFGSVEDVIHDCCGFCPKPETDEDLAALEDERKIYISGDVQFLKDDPGRQAIGSFHPLTDDDWTEQAYIGNTTVLCQAIVDCDLEAVEDWFSNGELETVDVNRRDHAGRTPLLLATMCSTPEIVRYLIDHDARIVSRLYNGLTALHISAYRGETDMVKALCDRSEANENEEDRKEEARKTARRAAAVSTTKQEESESASEDDSTLDTDHESSDEMTEGSFVKVSDKNMDTEDDKDDPDVYDIDVLAWDAPLSPLHLAIIAGRIDVVKLLIEQYGADVLLPVKISSTYDRTPQSAILTLTLALQHPLSHARELIGALLAQGAISTQADMKSISALHYAVADAREQVVRAMEAKTDPASLKTVVNHVAVTARGYWSAKIEVPLITAIHTKQPDVMKHLLEVGARPEVDFESFAKSWDADGRSRSHEDTQKEFNKSVEQPLVVAVQEELPQFAMLLIEAGASVNVIPKAAHQFLAGQTYNQGNKSVRDLVAERVDGLKKWLREQSEHADEPKSPPEFAPDSTYLNYPKDSYKHWAAVNDLERAKEVKAHQVEEYQKELKRYESRTSDVSAEKVAAVQSTLEDMETLYAMMVKKGAKKFKVLHPDAPAANEYNNHYRSSGEQQSSMEPYKTVFNFKDSALTDAKRESYLKLFEAAWEGDLDVVKGLTLKNDQPLPIAIQDSAGFSPFSIAVIRGHSELARVIVEIATVQHKPDDNKPTYRYRIKGREDESEYDSDYSSEESDDDLRVLAELVDANFTVDDIATLANTVKSKVSPLEMIEWHAEFWRAHDEKPKAAKEAYEFAAKNYYAYNIDDSKSWHWLHSVIAQESTRGNSSPIRHAIVKNDMAKLKFLIEVATDLVAQQKDDDEGVREYDIGYADFDLAIALGRIELLGEIITSTGAAIPLQAMVKTSGVQVDEKPRYYQGLTVHGRKRQDWAAKSSARGTGRGRRVSAEVNYSLTLRSIFKGNLQSAEYFLSDAPLRRCLEFANRLKTDKRVAILAQAKGGIEGALSTWLSTRSELSLHIAIMSAPKGDGTTPMFDYLLKTRPDLIEVKGENGNTALLNAFKLRRIGIARALLKAGANQVVRNLQGENVLHIILADLSYAEPEVLRTTLALFDSKLVPGMLMEKSSSWDEDTYTPLARILGTSHRRDAFNLCEVLFHYSGGRDLEILNHAGDYPIHTVVRASHYQLVKQLVDYRPEMLHWENATGMTPMDVAETRYLRDLVEQPPKVDIDQTSSIINRPDREFKLETSKTADDLAEEELNAFIAGDDQEKLEERRFGQRLSSWRMYRLLQRLAAKYKGKRKLVSVLDANEVAKRLAFQQQKRSKEARRQERLYLHALGTSYGNRHDYYDQTEKPTQDEVSMWWSQAEAARKWDWERWRAEVTGEEFLEE